MVFIPRRANDEEILTIVRQWVDVLAREEYTTVFAELRYLMKYDDIPGDEDFRLAVTKYRSPDFYPGITNFKVSDWRTAKGGNPNPQQNVVRYKDNTLKMAGAIQFDLPLNGQWSDLTADFVFFDHDGVKEGYVLALEEIFSSTQRQREISDED